MSASDESETADVPVAGMDAAERGVGTVVRHARRVSDWTRLTLDRRDVRVALFIALIALCLRLGWVWHVLDGHRDLAVFPDSQGYLDPAHSLLDKGSFDARSGSDQPMWVRTPGYPTFLAAVAALFGRSTGPILVVQAFVSAASVLVVDRLGRVVAGARVGVIAAVLLALDPFSIASSGHVLTETLTQFLTVSFLLAVCRGVVTGRGRDWGAAGMLLACATLVRPATYYLVPVLALLIYLVSRTDRRQRVRATAVFLMPVVLLLGSWQIRNLVVVDSPQFTPIDALSFALWRGAAVEYRTGEYASYREAQLAVAERVARDFGVEDPDPADILRNYPPEGVSQREFWAAMRAEGLRLVASDPGIYFDEMVTGGRNLLYDVHVSERMYESVTDETSLRPGLRVVLLVDYLLVAIGLLVLLRTGTSGRRRRCAVLLLVVISFIFVISMGPESEERYRTPIVPALLVFAAVGASAVADRTLVVSE